MQSIDRELLAFR